MAPRKPPAKAPRPKTKRKSPLRMGKLFWVLGLLLLAGVGYLVARNYHLQSVRSDVESLIGELDPAGISIRVADAQGGQALLDQLRKVEGSSWGTFRISGLQIEKRSIKFDAVLRETAYKVEIYWEPLKVPTPKQPPVTKPPKRASLPSGAPRLALIIDDLGASVETARQFLDLPVAVTPAIIPFLHASTEVANLSASRKRPFLLHMPMEPLGYPKNNPGTGAILLKDDPDTVRRHLVEALGSVPGAKGVNNHMGSGATESGRLMEPFMAELGRRGLFFVDSMTSQKSVAAADADKAGLDWASRDVFLDNKASVPAIETQLALAVKEAKRRGTAVAIGHGKPETLEAIRNWAAKFEEAGVKIVPITEVLHKKDG